jgi:hypothetical protein
MTENCKFHKAIFSAFYNISQRNFGILLILWCSFKLWWNICLDQNLVYNANGPLAKSRADITWCQHRKFLSLYFFVLYYKKNYKTFSVLIYSYWISTLMEIGKQFLAFSISTCVDITVYWHGKCFIFVK